MTTDVIDVATFNELRSAVGAEFLTELVGAFVEDVPTMLGDLRTAVQTQDAGGFRRAAHSIKSNAHVFGATALAVVAARLEASDLSEAMPQRETQMGELEREIDRACAALRELQHG